MLPSCILLVGPLHLLISLIGSLLLAQICEPFSPFVLYKSAFPLLLDLFYSLLLFPSLSLCQSNILLFFRCHTLLFIYVCLGVPT